MKSREQLWNNWPVTADDPSSIFNTDYSKALRLDNEELCKINTLVFEIIYHSLEDEIKNRIESSENHNDIIRYLDDQASFSINVPKNVNRFTVLEQYLIDAMNRRGLLKHITGIQFPVDVRVVQSTPPPNYLDRKDAIDYMHCDGWRGEPDDGVNCLLYCWVNEISSQLHILDLPKNRMEPIASFQGDERDCSTLLDKLEPIEFSHMPGVMIFFDSFSPHHAKRQGNSTRISLNFSLRRTDVYSVLDERWDRNRQSWDKYWYLPEKGIDSFDTRCSSEISKLKKNEKNKAAQLRQEYINNKLLHSTNEVY